MSRVLCNALVKDQRFWAGMTNVEFPKYDKQKLRITGICFSPGRMGYAHLGDIIQDILNQGGKAGTLIGVESFSQDGYNNAVASDFLAAHVIYNDEKDSANIKIQAAFDSLLFLNDTGKGLAWERLLGLAHCPDVQYGTINAPEGAYGMVWTGGEFATPTSDKVKADMDNFTFASDPAKWTRFLLERFNAQKAFALVSCTNFSQNGNYTAAVVKTMAKAWEDKGYAPKGFVEHLGLPQCFTFPNTMVDRIAVSPNAAVNAMLDKAGISANVIVTEKTRYWAIEDKFPAGRPEFEKASGVFMCPDFDDLRKYEDMKLRILNMSHTTIASYGVMLGYRGDYKIYAAMQNPAITQIIRGIIDVVKATIPSPVGIKLDDFVADTFTRLNNPNIPDDPMRIALMASTKIAPRLMDTYWEGQHQGVSDDKLAVILIPVAAFLCYTTGVDKDGTAFALADDPRKDTLVKCASALKAGASVKDAFLPLLSDPAVFGKDLTQHPDTLNAICANAERMLKGDYSA